MTKGKGLMIIEIDRVRSNKHGTFGVLSIDGIPQCVTLEETWLNNLPNESCIPEGIYRCDKYSGTKHKNVWKLEDVPGRSAILIHIGNTERDTSGCILVGRYFADFPGGRRGIADSKRTMDMLRAMLPDRFKIVLRNRFDA